MQRPTRTPTTRGLPETSRFDRQEERIRSLEVAFALEQERRDQIEKKYTRLKRRYARLERAHAILQESNEGGTGVAQSAEEASPTYSTTSSSSSSATRRSPNTGQRETTGDLIDLTSPVGSRRTSLASPAQPRDSNGIRNSRQLSFSSEDFCAQSPASPEGNAAIQPMTTPSRRTYRVTRSAEQLQPAHPADPSVGSTRRRQLEFYTPVPSSRPRPRLGSNTSSFDTARLPQSPDWQIQRQIDATSPELDTQTRSNRSVAIETAEATSSPATRADDSDEAASIALAQYLQQQENQAAIEYHERLREMRENEHLQQQYEAAAATPRLHHGAVDPDNMTYEELIQLGEEVGDVKKERWRQVAVQVLSSMPTHRWTDRSGDDISCIICQYNFSAGDVALSLPCAHVFHEDCVTGWVRENNSCPLCKLEIADI